MEKLILLRVYKSFLLTFLPFDSTKRDSLFFFLFVFERDPHRLQGNHTVYNLPNGITANKRLLHQAQLSILITSFFTVLKPLDPFSCSKQSSKQLLLVVCARGYVHIMRVKKFMRCYATK